MLYSKNPTGLEACRTGTKMRFKTKPSLPESAVAKIPSHKSFRRSVATLVLLDRPHTLAFSD